MGIKNLSEGVILVDLPGEPKMVREMRRIIKVVGDGSRCDVVLDFSAVDMVSSPSLALLLRLRQLLIGCGCRIAFCNLNTLTMSTFRVTGLDGIFRFFDDTSAALAEFQKQSVS